MNERLPIAREDDLVVQELSDETLVYDLKRHKAHCLNTTAALVWRHCDGQRTPGELAGVLARELELPADEEMVRLALEQLDRARLLRERLPQAASGTVSRRELARRLAQVGVLSVLVPAVTSIVAPTAAQAATLLAPGACCTTHSQCVTGSCSQTNITCPSPGKACG